MRNYACGFQGGQNQEGKEDGIRSSRGGRKPTEGALSMGDPGEPIAVEIHCTLGTKKWEHLNGTESNTRRARQDCSSLLRV